MNKLIIYCFLFVITISLKAQIVVTHNDMPNIKDIYVVGINSNFGASFNYEDTGADFSWDISGESFATFREDTFVNLNATPLIFNIYFNNTLDPERRATIATPRQMPGNPPGITIKDVYFFLKESTDKFSEVGFGASVNGTPMPVKYDNPDVLYHFPITFGSQDSSFSSFALNIPSYGYLGQSKFRRNTVDGWGTISLPQGTFPAMRIKSELFLEDTIFYAQYNQGFKMNRVETEYKWIGNGVGIPLLLIAERMNSITMEVFDSMYVSTAGVNTISSETQASVFPNPVSDFLYLNFRLEEPTDVVYNIYDLQGRVVVSLQRGKLNAGMVMDKIDLKQENLSAGLYILEIQAGQNTSKLRLQILSY